MLYNQTTQTQNNPEMLEEGDSIILRGETYTVIKSEPSEITVILDALLKEVIEEDSEEIAMERAKECVSDSFKYYFKDKKELSQKDIVRYDGVMSEKVQELFYDTITEENKKISRKELENNIVEKLAETLEGEAIEELKNDEKKMGDTSIIINDIEYRYFDSFTETLSLPLDEQW